MLQNSTFPRFSVTLESGDVYCGPIHSSLLRAGRGKAFFVLLYIRGGYYLQWKGRDQIYTFASEGLLFLHWTYV